MNNEYFTEIMLQFAKLEAKIDSLEQEIKVLNAYVDTQLKNKYYGTEVVVTEDIKPEHLSNFWNEEGETEVKFKNFGSFHLGATLDDNCIWETIPAEQRTKPMGIVCPCKKCTPH